MDSTEKIARDANRAQDKLSVKTLFVWTSRLISTSVNYMVLGFLTIYCSDVLGLNVAVVGTLMLVTKIIDAVLSVPIGYMVDRTNTKLGRGRPYELCLIGVWVATILMFSCPNDWSHVVKYIWVFTMFVANNGIFGAFLNAAGNPYMVRAFNNQSIYVKLGSYGGILNSLGALAVNIIFPMMMARLGSSHGGWIAMMLIIGVPAMLIGLLRFFFVSEKYDVDVATEKLNFREVITVLKTNKYIWPVTLMVMINAAVANMGIMTYYYRYVVGNLDLMSLATAISAISLPSLVIMPWLLRKISVNQACFLGFILCIVGYGMNWFAADNFSILMPAAILTGLGCVPVNMFNYMLSLECADYNEWNGQPRMEATFSTIPGLGNQIGGAFGAFLLGQLLNMSGYVSSTAGETSQPDSAILMIRILFSIVPMVLFALAAVCSRFYTLEKKLPQIQADNERRRAEALAAKNETTVTETDSAVDQTADKESGRL